MKTSAEIVDLIAELKLASQVYYHTSSDEPQDYELMEDEEFDAKVELLEEYVDTYPDLFEDGSDGYNLLDNVVALGTEIEESTATAIRAVPMLSLGKAKTHDELERWINRIIDSGATDFQLQAKLDGFAVSAIYINGKLNSLSTRGLGDRGEDTTYLIKSDRITIVGLPDTLDETVDIEVRGEMFLTDEQFETNAENRREATGEQFKNSRNGIVGTIKKAIKGLNYNAEMTFAVYSVIKDDALADMETIEEYGFTNVNTLTTEQDPTLKLTGFTDKNGKVDKTALYTAVDAFGAARPDFNIPTDGVVIKPTNEAEMYAIMGVGSHHPKSQVAYKFPGMTAITDIEGIDITVGRTGRITPVARFTPTVLDGNLIENASLHNFNKLYELGAKVGSTVKITRANDVIPQVDSVIVHGDEAIYPVPTECPTCETSLVVAKEEKDVWPPRTLRCPNLTCPDREFHAIKHAISKELFNIDRMSEAILGALRKVGKMNDLADLYTLDVETLAELVVGDEETGNLKRLGERHATHIMNHIDAAKTLPLYKVLASLNIIGLGKTLSKVLVARFKTLDAILELSAADLIGPQIAEGRATEIASGLKARRPLIDRLIAAGVTIEGAAEVNTESAINGLAFSISGTVPNGFTNRNALSDWITANGGTWHSSPKANTDYFIGSEDDTSSKAKAAVKHRDSGKSKIQIISPEQFNELFNK